MQRKWLLLAAGAMLSTVIAGCSENHGELGNRNIRQQSVREDGNGNMHVRYFAHDQLNEQNRMNGRRLNSNNIIGSHRNYRLELDTNIAQRLSSLPGVGTAYVMLTNTNAYVAVDGRQSNGMSAKSQASSMRPLSRTDMAYLPPSAHKQTYGARAYAHPFSDTMGNSNYAGMLNSSTGVNRFDGRKSYDSTKLNRKSVEGTVGMRSGMRTRAIGGARTYAHTFRDAMGISNFAGMLQSTGELNRIGDRMQYDAMNNKNVANDRVIGMRSASGAQPNGTGAVQNDRESTLEAQMDRGRRMNSRVQDMLRDRARYTKPAQRGNTTSGATTVRPYGGELGRGMSIGYQNSIDYDMYGSGDNSRSVRPLAMAGTSAVRIDSQLQAAIEREVRRMAPSVNHVYVSSNADFVHRMASYAEDVHLGHPIQGYITEFNAMVERVFPARALRNR